MQVQFQGITDVGLISPAEAFGFFRKSSFGPDREESAPMQLGSLLESSGLRTEFLQMKMSEIMALSRAESD